MARGGRKGRRTATNSPGGGVDGRAETQTRAATLKNHCSIDERRAIEDAPAKDDFQGSLDQACTSAAIVANRLAATVRYLDAYDQIRDGTLGREVARVAALATTAAQATEMLHTVARDYADWMVA